MLLLPLPDKVRVSSGADAEGEDNASHRSEEEKTDEEVEEQEKEENGAGATKKTVHGYCCSVQDWVYNKWVFAYNFIEIMVYFLSLNMSRCTPAVMLVAF